MFKELFFGQKPPPPPPRPEALMVGGRMVPLQWVRHPRARRYLLRLHRDGTIRLTVPRGGSIAEALRFAESQTAWLERQVQKLASQPVRSSVWQPGTEVLFRGELRAIELAEPGVLRLGPELIKVGASTDLRPPVENHLFRLAARELPPRVVELARQHGSTVRRVTVRNQRSRWGSCSRRGTISLNWRLIQTPEHVRDYIILHELMHLRQMNHSAKFWQEVEQVCPDYLVAEKWLKQHAGQLRA